MDKEDLDFVICALPTYLHKKYAVMAMEKGLHVFSEKPMARWSAEAQEMIEVSQKTGKKLMIGQCLRFSGLYEKAKEYIDSGIYGKVLRAEFKRYSCLPACGPGRKAHLHRPFRQLHRAGPGPGGKASPGCGRSVR